MIRRSITLAKSNGSKKDSFFDPKTDPNIMYAVRKLMNAKIKKITQYRHYRTICVCLKCIENVK